jgi:hypothetical protein
MTMPFDTTGPAGRDPETGFVLIISNPKSGVPDNIYTAAQLRAGVRVVVPGEQEGA